MIYLCRLFFFEMQLQTKLIFSTQIYEIKITFFNPILLGYWMGAI
jgi:hypothetical protein